ncbi:nucleotidyltransferase family protein [Variovorax sp. PvP013]|uniref:nucleotidyltransferase family protein n=1 Tax=Variovorax sp. PvP013 TaxID=3156435 RepID=UPI003D1D8604
MNPSERIPGVLATPATATATSAATAHEREAPADAGPAPTVIVLASGRGERFRASGGTRHKLDAPLGGRPVRERTLAAVRASGLPWHVEDAGHPGMGDSIAAAVRATTGAAGWLVLPADLPLVRPATLRRVARALREASATSMPTSAPVQAPFPGASPAGHAVQPVHAGRRGHPVAFSAACRDELLRLSGEFGAAPVLQRLRAAGRVVELAVDDAGIVTDIDTLADLAAAEALLLSRAAEAAQH